MSRRSRRHRHEHPLAPAGPTATPAGTPIGSRPRRSRSLRGSARRTPGCARSATCAISAAPGRAQALAADARSPLLALQRRQKSCMTPDDGPEHPDDDFERDHRGHLQLLESLSFRRPPWPGAVRGRAAFGVRRDNGPAPHGRGSTARAGSPLRLHLHLRSGIDRDRKKITPDNARLAARFLGGVILTEQRPTEATRRSALRAPVLQRGSGRHLGDSLPHRRSHPRILGT